MKKKVELEKKYQFANNDKTLIDNYFQTIKAAFDLKGEITIINNDIYYDNDDILEAYKITVRKRKVNGKDVYTLKRDISENKNIIKKEIYDFDSLEEVINFIREKYNCIITSLHEKIKLDIQRQSYTYNYGNAVIEILFDELSIESNNKNYMMECKYVSGDFKDFEKFNEQLNTYSFLHEVVVNKKELGEEYIPKTIENPFNKKVDLEEYSKMMGIYFNGNLELLDKLKKLNERKDSIKQLHKTYGPLEKPIVITISGTPRAGKTTCIDNLFEFFKKADFKTACVEEPAGLVYATLKSKEEKAKLLQDRVGFVERQLEIGEDSINQKLNNNEILLCDRGVLDTYIWYDMYYKLGMMDRERYLSYLEGLKREFKYFNQFYILYASSLTSMYRDYQNSLSIEPRSTMNEENVQRYNSSLIRMLPTFESSINSVKFMDTSEYAKMDASIIVANDLVDKIEKIYRRRK